MMKKAIIYILLICSVVLGSSPAVATDTDSESATAGNDWVEVDFSLREDNDLGLYPPGDQYQLKFSKQDCINDIELNFEFVLKGDALSADTDLYLLVSDVDVDCSDDADIDQCGLLESKSFVVSDGATEATVGFTNLTLQNLMGVETAGECTTTTNTISKRLWIGLLETEGSYDSTTDLLYRFGKAELDFQGPSQIPPITRVLVGNDNLEVYFEKQTATAVKGFFAVVAKADGADCAGGPLTANASVEELQGAGVISETAFSESSDETSLKISGLENDQTYQVAVATVDEAGNPSALSAPECAAPQKSIGIGDAVSSDGEFCFIATAAFDSYEHPTVKVLRVFRDQFLKDLPLGSTMISAYYSVGPGLAALIQGDAQRKEMVRSALGLFAGLTTVLVDFGAFWVMLGLLGALLLGLMLGFSAPRAKEK